MPESISYFERRKKKANVDPAYALGNKTSWGDSISVRKRERERGEDIRKDWLNEEGCPREMHINVWNSSFINV